MTRPNITFPIRVVSQLLYSPCDGHWNAVIHIRWYIQFSPGKEPLSEEQQHAKIVGYSDAN